jgi:hypothetical protein
VTDETTTDPKKTEKTNKKRFLLQSSYILGFEF